MSYQTLYRKYRPKTLKEVYGQNVITKILTNAIESDRFAHAYLFTGPRGCGKTSVAKIVARMVNCTNLKKGAPCNKCPNCLESIQDNCIDIIEIDAASNNGVDEIRELKNSVSILPSNLKYKVYIIDEVHMLSTGAFNALLKTLEEPPEHVIFILATTDLEKVPITIISRCQTLEFKKINHKDMFDRLKEISEIENIKIEDDALMEIVEESDGGLRDAVSLLDLASSYSDDVITDNDIMTINGNISMNEIDNITDDIINNKIGSVIKKIDELNNGGKDLIKLTEKIIKNLNARLVKETNTNICSIYEMLLESLNNMKKSNLEYNYLMLALYKIEGLHNDPQTPVEVVQEITVELPKIDEAPVEVKKEEVFVEESKPKEKKSSKKEKRIVDIKDTRMNNAFAGADKTVLTDIKKKWTELEDYTLDRKYGAYICELIDVVPTVASKDYLVLCHKYDSFVDKGNNNIFDYEEALKKTIKLNYKLVFITEKEWQRYKDEYIENTNNKVKYEIKEEIIEEIDNSTEEIVDNDIIKKANELFENIEIEIEE